MTEVRHNAVDLCLRVDGDWLPNPTICLQDILGAGAERNRGIGIVHTLVNLAIEYLQGKYGQNDSVLKGEVFPWIDADSGDRARRVRFFARFGIDVDAFGKFSTRIRDLKRVYLAESRKGLPQQLTLAMMEPVELLPGESPRPRS